MIQGKSIRDPVWKTIALPTQPFLRRIMPRIPAPSAGLPALAVAASIHPFCVSVRAVTHSIEFVHVS
jgi:hypothetical protein